MPADVMVGVCQMCGKVDNLDRTYFRYENIKCECHSPCHVIIVDHCKDCVPEKPKETKVSFSVETLNDINTVMQKLKEIKNIMEGKK